MALSVQLEEAKTYAQGGKGKFRAGSPPDSVLAFDSFRLELETYINFLKDMALAHSMAQAVDADAALIASMTLSDQQVEQDRILAVQLDAEVEDNGSWNF